MASVVKSVAILGAGVAGLTTAKMLKQYGLEVTVYEAKAELGGVWASGYKSLGVQEPSCVYGIPDWPWPAGTPLYPAAEHVRSYLDEYARHFGIFECIKFNTKIVKAIPGQQGRWKIESETSSEVDSAEFDFFIMSPGMFNLAKLPNWSGMENFAGEVIHSSQFRDTAQVKNKRVAIIGFSRSALDIAVNIIDDADAVSVLHRSVRWPVPQKILGLIRHHVLLFARWPNLFTPPWIRPTRTTALLHSKGKFLVSFFWKFFEVLLSTQLQLKRLKLLPDRSIKLDLFTNLYVNPRRFFSMVSEGRIRSIRSEIASFEKDAILMSNGEKVAVDLVICATGWKHDYSFLPSTLLERIYDEDGMHLYRHMVHPDLPGMAFVGGVQCLNSATCYAIQATWVARYLSGQLSLPSTQEQLDEIESLKAWNQAFVTSRANRSQIINLHQLPYIDDLMEDMGLSKRRKNILIDKFVPYHSVDYQDVVSNLNPH